jgi:hypothetical protein
MCGLCAGSPNRVRWMRSPNAGAPGFRLGYFIGDRQQNTAAGVTVWEQQPDEALIGLGIHAFQEQIQDLTLGPATVELYEVLVEV